MSKTYLVFKDQSAPSQDQPWTDDLFPPNTESILNPNDEQIKSIPQETLNKIDLSNIEFKRLNEIIADPVLFEGEFNVDKIQTGKVNFIHFHSVLVALGKYSSFFNRIILSKNYNPSGFYEILLNIDGEFQKVYIDDYFPCLKNTNMPYFIKPTGNEFWELLIEKALAKIFGSYLNILNHKPSELFEILTGSSGETLIHKNLNTNDLIKKINDIKNNKEFATLLSSNENEIEKYGLIKSKIYLLIDSNETEINDKKYFICKLKDPTYETKFYPEHNELYDKIDKNIFVNSNGEFWISIDDIKNYFSKTEICHIIFDCESKIFNFENNELLKPKIFNFYLSENSKITCSIIDNNSKNTSLPKSLLIAEYDPATLEIKNTIGDYESFENLNLTQNLNAGYYIVWAFKYILINNYEGEKKMKIKFSSDKKLTLKFMGNDEDFLVIGDIIYKAVKYKNKNNNEIIYDTGNSFSNSGLGYKICINPTNNINQFWKFDLSKIENFYMFPPFDNDEKYEFNIDPNNNYKIIIGIKKQKYGEHWFNIEVEAQNKNSAGIEIHNSNPDCNIFYSKNESQFESLDPSEKFSYDEISRNCNNNPVVNDQWKTFLESKKEKYSFVVSELEKLTPLEDVKKSLNCIETNNNDNIYIGEAINNVRTGRGAYIFNNGTIYIGYFNEGKQYKQGKVFNSNKKLCYEGEYKHGKKEGKGTAYYEGGEEYNGYFVNGLREGKGVFKWNDGTEWRGIFKNDEMNGSGMFVDGEESYEATYKDGDLIEN